MPGEPLIRNVSDTARWVAVYRAQESARADALFQDPYAARLAGDRGKAIAARAPRSMRNGWPMVTRTKLIDDLVTAAVAEGCDAVVNLAAGFDTRPYRMVLPESLDWIEADLPALLEEKDKLLQGEKPRCRLRREAVDLSDAAARDTFLLRMTAGHSKVLVLTEGLLGYLDDDAVRAIARGLAARSAIRWWILDLAAPAILRMIQKGMGSELDQAPMKFAPENGVAFFETLGWKAKDIRSMFREAVRWRRVPLLLRAFSFLPEPNPRKVGRHARWSAVVRFERAS